MKPILSSLFVSLFLASTLQCLTLPLHAERIVKDSTIQIQNIDSLTSSGLEELGELIGDKKIVLLGESNHDNGDPYEIKTAIIKYLHEELGFNYLFFESGFYDLWKANKEIKKGVNPEAALAKSIFRVWTTHPKFQPLLNYIGKNKESLQVYGFDCQVSGELPLLYFTQDLNSFLTKVGSPLSSSEIASLDKLIGYLSRMSLPEDFPKDQFKVVHNSITNKLENSALKADTDVVQVNFWKQALTSYYNFTLSLSKNNIYEISEDKWVAHYSNPRDAQMTENFLFLRKNFPDEKIICWGATAHLMNSLGAGDVGEEMDSFISMGSLIRKDFSDQIFCLALSTSQKTPIAEVKRVNGVRHSSTLEDSLSRQKMDYALVDLSQSEVSFRSEVLGSAEQSIAAKEIKWGNLVDAIFYYRSAPLTDESLPAKPGYLKGRVFSLESQEAIPYAHVYTKHAKVLSSTDRLGTFFVKVNNEKLVNDTLMISSVGFKTREIPLATLESIHSLDSIYLTENSEILNEVTVTANSVSPESLVKKVIEGIPDNYYGQDFGFKTFYKRSFKTEHQDSLSDNLLMIADGVNKHGYEKRTSSHSKNTPCFSIKEVKNIPNPFWDESFNYGTLYGYGFPLADMLDYDNNVLNERNLDSYMFKVAPYDSSDDKFVISFECKKPSYKNCGVEGASSYNGHIIVNADDYGVEKTFIRFQLNSASRFNNHRESVENPEFTIFAEYTKEDKYFLNKATITLSLYSKEYKNTKLIIKQDYTVLDRTLSSDFPACTHNYEGDVAFDPAFWENFIKPY